MRDPYEVLGVGKSASAKDIKSAFRKLAKKHHPDQNPNDAKAKDRFAAVNAAYEIIGDDKKRAAFDRGEIDAEGKPRFQGFEGAAGGDPFSAFRRAGAQGFRTGPGGAHFEFRTTGPGGPGGFGDADDILSEMLGSAFGRGPRPGGPRPGAAPRAPETSIDLPVTLEEAASGAHVAALLPGGRRLAVKLPRFVEDGQTIRLKGQADDGGDVMARIRFRSHPRYRPEGRNLHVDLFVGLDEAVLGGKAPVETLTGKLALSVPPWSGSDKVLRLKNRGLPLKEGGHGDLLVHVRILLPDERREELERLLRRDRAGA